MSQADSSTAANCPYCGIRFSMEGVDAYNTPINFHSAAALFAGRTRAGDPVYTVSAHLCPDCQKPVMWLNEISIGSLGQERSILATHLLWPKFPARPLSPLIPERYRLAASEAAAVLQISPKASAALSRRSLQDVLREVEGLHGATLQTEIAAVLAKKSLPPYLGKDLDAIRIVGNFAAHPIKDTNTGEVVDVEPGEAEWTLEVLEGILEFYFANVQQSADRREALNVKLRKAGKPPLP